MEIETDEEVLRQLAAGGAMDYAQWPNLLQSILSRLDKIAHDEFPIPALPPPPQQANAPGQQRTLPPLLSSSLEAPTSRPSSQDADKENNQPQNSAATTEPTVTDDPEEAPAPALPVTLPPGVLPPQLDGMLTEINNVLTKNFTKFPPHTIQRVSELLLEPRQHYRHLASYLHALDRVVHVTSTNNIYPLPPAIPDMSTMTLLSNGVTDPVTGAITSTTRTPEPKDPAANVSWGNPTTAAPPASGVGSDEALGGALLTPIPWLTRRPSPRGDSASSSPTSTHSGSGPSPGTGQQSQGQHEIRTESTETIEGPNGMGHIETVTISVNGISSAASSAATGPRPITQGELLRQEQQRGVVPVSQLARQAEEAAAQHIHAAAAQLAAAQAAAAAARAGSSDIDPDADPDADDDDMAADASTAAAPTTDTSADAVDGDEATTTSPAAAAVAADADEVPHARGPAEIGADDLGPQSASRTTYGGPGVEMQGIDVEAAVGRKPDEEPTTSINEDDAASDAESEASQKREADADVGEGPAPKKRKDGDGDEDMSDDGTEDKTEKVDSAKEG
ncbi:hypothetical protein HYQ45_002191 [Verticillium longisporum]|uniref:Uncharacterized protein n=1 Tax=Verticillium longisporum TaxID=100787 RepID=A0A8I2ZZ78_VERLO|nr:hypothetical protein HYQ45_002191 [Verticillium longisporum]